MRIAKMAITRIKPRNGGRRLSQMRVTCGAGESEVVSVAISVALIVFRKGRRAMTEYTAKLKSGNGNCGPGKSSRFSGGVLVWLCVASRQRTTANATPL